MPLVPQYVSTQLLNDTERIQNLHAVCLRCKHGTHVWLLQQGDLEDSKTVDDIANKVRGKVDILVNNAGMLDKESILQGVRPL